MGFQYLKSLSQVFQVRSPTRAVNQDVVEEYQYKLSQVWSEDKVHHYLECRWCIAQAKGHDEIFVMPIVSPKCCLLSI